MEIEKSFKCPFCRETVSFLIDLSIDGAQTYIEDCEVCCRPIQAGYVVEQGQLVQFSVERAQ